ncbi:MULTISPECIES: NUDIX hydrolase [unclassified Pseudoalteromonas]|uniref:NUDIX hydrolase n=1 Tax=unclassified Pseudoalteromonas TaxID=194690 RepID=UPI001601913F|nr:MULTISPECIES: NUDIX hydrolase [unclassified Pseudoalteromonas]MBB1276172.1 NUDIX domain-containing protein [Pseudoalteromonas sp. SR43-3]MBB1324571.1 NUDIX domain-containing protein [Pseudoalteromonas sp. SR45-1]
MQQLKTLIHSGINIDQGTQFTRLTARAIVIKNNKILLMYTNRYEDYSLPGGGVDDGESIEQGLIRELSEETGAQQISVVKAFGLYEEYRPWYKDDFDIIHIKSYCFVCSIADKFGKAQLEHYEQQNGMTAKWVDINDAIAHNERTIANSEKQGLSILRETYLLKRIAKELI